MPSDGVAADDVTAALIKEHPGLDQMQIHKLLYLVQAASLSWYGRPAFDARIEAWRYGPVVRGIAGRYRAGKDKFEEPVAGNPEALPVELADTVRRIARDFTHLSGPTLASMVKGPESPWQKARSDLPASADSNAEIELGVIQQYHRERGLRPAQVTKVEREGIGEFWRTGSDESLASLFEAATGVRPSITA